MAKEIPCLEEISVVVVYRYEQGNKIRSEDVAWSIYDDGEETSISVPHAIPNLKTLSKSRLYSALTYILQFMPLPPQSQTEKEN